MTSNLNIKLLRGLLLGILFTLTGCSDPPYNNLDNQQLRQMMSQGVPVYDIRRPDEWRQTGVIENSELLTFVDQSGRLSPGFMSNFTQKVGKNDPVILICRTGNRTSALARHLMENMGYTNIHNVEYGITHWIGEGNPVKRL